MLFEYTADWLNKPGAMPLSQSLPLRKERFKGKECRGFFAGILPEESKREIIARNLGISARNDYAMLEQIGGECAGAVTFIPAGGPLPERNYGYRKLSEKELAAILRELPKRPLLAGDEGIRLSLAGAQDKVAVRIEDGQVSVPLGGAPSTHILKPAVERFEGVVFNEALCMRLAAAAGLPAAGVETRSVDGVDFLLVERYDRYHRQVPGAEPVLERLHQEDFCQAQGIVSEMKYQKEGGPSLKQCFGLLREVSSAPVIDLARLLDAVIYNYLVGNNDAHGKNFSLLYKAGKRQSGDQAVTALRYRQHGVLSRAQPRNGDETRPRIFIGKDHAAGFRAAGGRGRTRQGPGQTPRSGACRDRHRYSRENRDRAPDRGKGGCADKGTLRQGTKQF